MWNQLPTAVRWAETSTPGCALKHVVGYHSDDGSVTEYRLFCSSKFLMPQVVSIFLAPPENSCDHSVGHLGFWSRFFPLISLSLSLALWYHLIVFADRHAAIQNVASGMFTFIDMFLKMCVILFRLVWFDPKKSNGKEPVGVFVYFFFYSAIPQRNKMGWRYSLQVAYWQIITSWPMRFNLDFTSVNLVLRFIWEMRAQTLLLCPNMTEMDVLCCGPQSKL